MTDGVGIDIVCHTRQIDHVFPPLMFLSNLTLMLHPYAGKEAKYLDTSAVTKAASPITQPHPASVEM